MRWPAWLPRGWDGKRLVRDHRKSAHAVEGKSPPQEVLEVLEGGKWNHLCLLGEAGLFALVMHSVCPLVRGRRHAVGRPSGR